MGEGEHANDAEIDPDAERRWRLARRQDLAHAFGIMFVVPPHAEDEQGRWRFGLRPEHGWASPDLSNRFVQEMEVLIANRATELVTADVITPGEAQAIEEHNYSIGPAAQEWPKVFFDLYQNARPFLNDGASLLAWAYFFIGLFRDIRAWAARTEREEHGLPESEANSYSGTSVLPGVALTRPALVALCYADLVGRHGVVGDVVLETFPRSRFGGYFSSDHPGGQESYLIRARSNGRSFYYYVLGDGDVLEHYVMERSKITLLPIPNLRGEEMPAIDQVAEPAQRVIIKIGNAV